MTDHEWASAFGLAASMFTRCFEPTSEAFRTSCQRRLEANVPEATHSDFCEMLCRLADEDTTKFPAISDLITELRREVHRRKGAEQARLLANQVRLSTGRTLTPLEQYVQGMLNDPNRPVGPYEAHGYRMIRSGKSGAGILAARRDEGFDPNEQWPSVTSFLGAHTTAVTVP